MSLVLKDRVRQTTTTAGTGTITLSGSVTGYQNFSAIGNGSTTYYTIADQSGANWEVGVGVYTTATQTLSRATVLSSSNGGSLVSFGAGTKDVFITLPSEKAVYLDTNDYVGIGTTTPGYPLEVRTAPDAYGIAHTDGTHSFSTYVGASGVAIGAETNDPLILKTGDFEQMRIDTAGNVGIGTTTPTVKLDVNGGIAGTIVQAKTYIEMPPTTSGNDGWGYIQMANLGGGYDVLDLYSYDYTNSSAYYVRCPYGLAVTPLYLLSPDWETNYQLLTMQIPSGMSSGWTLTFPATAGSANQVLQTDGTGVTSWVTPNTGAGAFTTLSASSTVSGTGFSTYLASPPAIGGTAPAAGTFTTLSATSVANTSSIARSGGKTSVLSILNQATYTSGGVTLASQTAANNATWRIRAFGTFTAANNATVRTAQVAVFWNSTQLVAITPTVLASTAQTTSWQLEFTVTGSSTTAVWTAGTLLNRIASATALTVDNATAGTTTVTSGSQTIDLRFRVSTAVASEGWNVQSVTIERLV